MALKRLIVCVCLCTPVNGARADPGDAIGSAVAVVNQVTGAFRQDVRTLTTGDDVVQEEVIAAGLDSVAELVLRDQTKLAIGPGARLTLDRFVYSPDKTSGAIVLNLLKGGFRFITGVAAKPFYSIRTPVAAITVRGTIFDVFVEEGGPVWLLLHEGSIRACNERGECRSLDDPCRVLRIGPGGELQDPGTWNGLPAAREVNFERAFPFVVKTPGVDPAPIFTRADIELGRCPEPKVRKAEEPTPKVKKAEAPERRAKRKVRRTRQARRVYPRSAPSSPGISIGIGIGIGGGGRGGGGGNH
jgi:hypothetical protein